MDKDPKEEMKQLVQNINEAVKAAENYADQHKLSFTIEPSYGMGGTYYGYELSYSDYGEDSGWVPSSATC